MNRFTSRRTAQSGSDFFPSAVRRKRSIYP